MNEDWDDMAAAEPLAGEELERVLARYARVRLEPGQARARRARAAVMELAWRQRIHAASPTSPARRGPFAGWGARRIGVSFSAAVLAGLVLGTTAFASSRAGGPLYETRLALEALALPSDPAARVDAGLAAAQTRLAEAVEASGRGDGPAVVAALAAYDHAIDGLAAADGDAADRALAAIQFHHEVLLRISGTVPAVAAAGLDRALANSERVMDRLVAGGAHGEPGTGGGSGGSGGAAGGNPGGKPTPGPTGTPGDTVKPGRTKDPVATPKPARTEAPEPTEKATAKPTQKPGKTPPPRRTPDPGKPGGGEREPAPTKRP